MRIMENIEYSEYIIPQLTGLQSQFSFCPWTTWFEVVYFLQMSLSKRLLSPGIKQNSANILCT